MAINKYAAYCIVFFVFGVIIIIILAFVLPIIIPQFAQEVAEEASQIIPGYDTYMFTAIIISLLSILMISIKKKIEKKTN